MESNAHPQENLIKCFFEDMVMMYGTTPWKTTLSGHTIRLKLNTNNIIHPFKGIFKGARLYVEFSSEKYGIFFKDECLLITWNDDPNGSTIQLRLNKNGGNHPFEVIDNNDILLMKAWILSEDETLSHKPMKFSDYSPVRQAAIMENVHTEFHCFCYNKRDFLSKSGNYETLLNPEISSRFTKETIKAFCCINSKKILGEDSLQGLIARKKWFALLGHFNSTR